MKLKSFSLQDINNKTVLVRTDYNVPLHKKWGKMIVAEPQRIQDSIPLINELRKAGAKVILMSHLGRPKGEVSPDLSLEPVARYLKEKEKLPVHFASLTLGKETTKIAASLQPGEILLLENLRFQPEEKKNDAGFAKQLAQLADIYINEAFSACHRAHASVAAITRYIPSFAGINLQKEVENLSRLLSTPAHPFVIIIGGAKISDKVEAVQNLHKVADLVLLGGGVANNFLKASGIETHQSYLEETDPKSTISYLDLAGQLISENQTERVLKDGYIPLPKLLPPIDVIAAKDKETRKTITIDLSSGMKDTPDDKELMYLDIGPRTIRLYSDFIAQAQTVFWNGPMGVFEKPQFAQGTKEVARAIAKTSAETFVGGGDTIAAIKKFGYSGRYDFVSSAGGAALEYLAGKQLPGLDGLC